MDNEKTGRLIKRLRTERGLTQIRLAEALGVSDKAVSKWERGRGAPEVSLLKVLSDVFGVNIEKILQGEMEQNDSDGGNMKRIKFYVCPSCGNVLTATGGAEISCCGRRLEPLEVKSADGAHTAKVERIEDDYFVTISHEMTKTHYLAFAAYVMSDRLLFIRLYPEQSAELRFPRMQGGRLVLYCTEHGLFELKLK